MVGVMVIVGEKAADVGAVDAASRVTTYARACVRRPAMTSSRTRKGARQPVDRILESARKAAVVLRAAC